MNIYYVREKLRNCSIYDIELNVAYYARVSTEKVEQQASIKHQEEHFEELIHSIIVGRIPEELETDTEIVNFETRNQKINKEGMNGNND